MKLRKRRMIKVVMPYKNEKAKLAKDISASCVHTI